MHSYLGGSMPCLFGADTYTNASFSVDVEGSKSKFLSIAESQNWAARPDFVAQGTINMLQKAVKVMQTYLSGKMTDRDTEEFAISLGTISGFVEAIKEVFPDGFKTSYSTQIDQLVEDIGALAGQIQNKRSYVVNFHSIASMIDLPKFKALIMSTPGQKNQTVQSVLNREIDKIVTGGTSTMITPSVLIPSQSSDGLVDTSGQVNSGRSVADDTDFEMGTPQPKSNTMVKVLALGAGALAAYYALR